MDKYYQQTYQLTINYYILKLQEFISNTLEQIVNAIVDSNISLESTGAEISPLIKTDWKKLSDSGFEISQKGIPVREIEFDIAITAEKEKTKGGNMGLNVSVVSLKGGKDSKSIDSTISRIKFKIPVTYPTNNKS